MEVVAHALFFGVHVTEVVVVGLYLDGDVLDDFEPVAFESNAFDGVIGHQAHFVYAEKIKYLSTDAVVALVSTVAEVYVGLDGIKSLFLKLISADFIHQTDAATLLIEIDHGASPLALYHAQGLMELLAAVAAL